MRRRASPSCSPTRRPSSRSSSTRRRHCPRRSVSGCGPSTAQSPVRHQFRPSATVNGFSTLAALCDSWLRGPSEEDMSPLRPYLATALLTMLVGACTDDSLSVKPLYNPTTRHVVVEASRDLASDEALFVRTRRGQLGTIDCAEVAATTEPISSSGLSIEGPEVDPA